MGNWLIKNTAKQILTMDNFFKQFKDNLDNLPEPAFQERDWQALAHRLPPQREKRPIATLLLWMLAPLFLMSLAANGFQYHEIKNTYQKMATLESRVDTILYKKMVVVQSDTVFKTRTIYEHDTVYKTKILREKEIVYLPNLPERIFKVNNAPLFKTSEPTGNLTEENNEKIAAAENDFTDKKWVGNRLEKLNSIALKNLEIRKFSKIPELNTNPIVFHKKKTLRERLEPLRPKGYSAGISAGLAYPISDISSKPSGYSAGVQGAMAFSTQISAWSDIQFMQLNYKADRMNDAIGIPVVAPPSNDFKFNLVKVTQPMMQYMAGLRYRFDRKKQGNPYIGVGYGAVTSLSYEVDYEFKNGSLGTVWEVSQRIKKQNTQWGFLLFEAGFEKRISKHYLWQLGANYRLKLSNPSQTYRLLGVKTGILFDF